MSLLNFLFRERKSKPEADPEVAEEETLVQEPVVEPDVDVAESELGDEAFEPFAEPQSLTDPDGTLDLEQIREILNKIAEILNEDEEHADEEEDLGNLSTIDLSMAQVAELTESLFKDGHPRPEDGRQIVGVRIADLYDQLKTGRVVTTLARLLSEVPAEMLVNPADGLSKDEVLIPLDLAVTSVRPDELMRRTSSQEMEVGLKDMPNLFSMGGEKPALNRTQAPEPGPDLFGPASRPAGEPSARTLEPAARLTPPRVGDAGASRMHTGSETAVQEPPVQEPKRNGEMFARAPKVEEQACTAPESPAVTKPPVRPASAPPPASSESFCFEFNENATPFRRADEVPEAEKAATHAPVEAKPEEPTTVEPCVTEPVADEPVVSAPPTATEPAITESVVNEPMTPPPPVVPQVSGTEAVAEPSLPVVEEMVNPEPASVVTGQGMVQLSGVDLNSATVEELTEKVDGVGGQLAANIIRYRDQNGSFSSVSDLMNVPGIGPTFYERLSGEPWSRDQADVKTALESIVGLEVEGYPDFRKVAERFCREQHFTGCLIIHADGHVLASAWEDDHAEVLGAIAPQIFKKFGPYAEQLGQGEVNPISLVFGGEVVTLVCSGEVLLAAIHKLEQLDKKQLRTVQLVSAELEARMGRVTA